VILPFNKDANILACQVTGDPNSFVATAVMDVNMWAGIKSCLRASTLDIIVGEVNWDWTTRRATAVTSSSSILQLLADNIGLEQAKILVKKTLD